MLAEHKRSGSRGRSSGRQRARGLTSGGPPEEVEAVLARFQGYSTVPVHTYGGRYVFELADRCGRRFVLKVFTMGTRECRKETHILEALEEAGFQRLSIPRLISSGRNYLLTEYVDRRVPQREAGDDSEWTDELIEEWVAALLEFQAFDLPREYFRRSEIVKGYTLPLISVFRFVATNRKTLSVRELLRLLRLVVRYYAGWTTIKRILTHYDLHEHNFAYDRTARRMTMIDVAVPFFRGDAFYDIAYYLSRPSKVLTAWTFERCLLSRFVSVMRGSGMTDRAIARSLRMNLLVCNMGRFRTRSANPNWKRQFLKNIRMMLHLNDLELLRLLTEPSPTGTTANGGT